MPTGKKIKAERDYRDFMKCELCEFGYLENYEDNTKPEFFALWSVRQLQVECARLNQVLKECLDVLEKSQENK